MLGRDVSIGAGGGGSHVWGGEGWREEHPRPGRAHAKVRKEPRAARVPALGQDGHGPHGAWL